MDWENVERSILLRQHTNKNNIAHLRKLIQNLNTSNSLELTELENELSKLPNVIHPRLWQYGNNAKELINFSADKNIKTTAVEFSELCKQMNIFRIDHLGNYTGHKSYYLLGKLAELEQALIQYTMDELKTNSFKLLSVPDILPKDIIEGCGMQTDGERTQVLTIKLIA